jgi:hypothetical protein
VAGTEWQDPGVRVADAVFLVLVWVPVAVVWALTVADVVRRADLGRPAKALWCVLVLCLPFFGSLVYLLVRPERPGRSTA